MKLPFDAFRGGNMYAENAAGVTLNHHLVMESYTYCQPKGGFETFNPSASNGAIEVPTSHEPLSAPWKSKGIQRETLKLFNTPFGQRRKFTYLGALVSEYGGSGDRELQVIATMYGRLDINFAEQTGMVGTEYEIKSIAKYVLQIGNEEILRFDIELGGWIDPEGQRARLNNMLGVTG